MTENAAPVVVTVTGSDTPAGLIITPPGQPNIMVKVITPLTIIAVRAVRVFLQTLLASPVVNVAGAALGLGTIISSYKVAASIAGGAAFICVLQNLLELAVKFDQSHPTLSS